jgi:hypothetical protein
VLDGVDPRLGRDAHTAGAMCVRRDAKPSVVRFGHRGRGLIRGVLRDLGRRAIAEDAGRREEPDDPRAGRDLLAHRFAHLIGTVGDPTDLEAVAARRRDATAGRDDPWTLKKSFLDRATELDDHRAVRAEVAHDRDARAQSRACVSKGLERGECVRLPDLGAEVRLAVEGEVAVAVDHPRQHESAGRRGDVGALALRRLRYGVSLTDPRDVATVDDHRRARHRPHAVEEPVDLEDSPHRAGSIVRRCPTR